MNIRITNVEMHIFYISQMIHTSAVNMATMPNWMRRTSAISSYIDRLWPRIVNNEISIVEEPGTFFDFALDLQLVKVSDQFVHFWVFYCLKNKTFKNSPKIEFKSNSVAG
jgi:hypothetical protein